MPNTVTATPQHDTVTSYLTDYVAFRQRLADIYARQGAVLEKKEMAWGMGTTWGYWLAEWRGMRPTVPRSAASIGEDEIRLFHDLAVLTQPDSAFVVGHSFGLSTLCLALATPFTRVVAIDNWGDANTSHLARPLSEAIIRDERLSDRVHVHQGTSPDDTAEALRQGGVHAPLALAFIDGLHREEAAAADFRGLVPHLSPRSVVLWHNVHLTERAFRTGHEAVAGWFDECHVLRTHGPLGIYFSSRQHPLLSAYLQQGSLIWSEWQRYIHLLTHERELQRFESLRNGAAWRFVAKVSGPLRRALGDRAAGRAGARESSPSHARG